MIYFITGGVRSGKSNFAQKMALSLSQEPVYIATATIGDEDFKQRVKRHQNERGQEWTNFEAYKHLYQLPIENKTVVIDCVTLWLTHFFKDYEMDIEKCLLDFKTEIDKIARMNGTFIIISNEIGMGVHADTAVARKFADLQGWANQYVAAKANEAIFMVSGLPLYLKKQEKHL